jgi:hypothetical protein
MTHVWRITFLGNGYFDQAENYHAETLKVSTHKGTADTAEAFAKRNRKGADSAQIERVAIVREDGSKLAFQDHEIFTFSLGFN